MSTVKYGEVSWNEKSSFSGKSGNDTYLHLDEGPNTIRIVTNPQQYVVHAGIKREGDKGYGQKIKCSKSNGGCVLCDMGFETGLRWYVGVIDRKSNSYKVFDIGPGVYYDIKGFNEGRWGDPKGYDMDIIKNSKTTNPQMFYSVQPDPNARGPLSAADQKIVDDQMDMEFLARAVTPLTPEKVQERLDKILDGGTLAKPVKKEKPKGKSDSKAAASVRPAMTTALPAVDGDDLEDLFPNHDADTAANS